MAVSQEGPTHEDYRPPKDEPVTGLMLWCFEASFVALAALIAAAWPKAPR